MQKQSFNFISKGLDKEIRDTHTKAILQRLSQTVEEFNLLKSVVESSYNNGWNILNAFFTERDKLAFSYAV